MHTDVNMDNTVTQSIKMCLKIPYSKLFAFAKQFVYHFGDGKVVEKNSEIGFPLQKMMAWTVFFQKGLVNEYNGRKCKFSLFRRRKLSISYIQKQEILFCFTSIKHLRCSLNISKIKGEAAPESRFIQKMTTVWNQIDSTLKIVRPKVIEL